MILLLILFVIHMFIWTYIFAFSKGMIVGGFLSIFFIILFSLVGDKIILIITKSLPYNAGGEVLDNVENISCRLSSVSPEIYYSNSIGADIIYLNTLFGKPALVIGKPLFSCLSLKEINSLIFAVILSNKSKLSICYTVVNLIFIFFYFPIFFVKKLKYLKFLSDLMVFMLLPIIKLEKIIFKDNLMRLENNIIYNMDSDYYLSSISKLSKLDDRNIFGLVRVIKNIGLVKNSELISSYI